MLESTIEADILNAFQSKEVKDLPSALKRLALICFGLTEDSEERIPARRLYGDVKPRIQLFFRQKRVNLLCKIDPEHIIHSEKLSSLCSFLEEIGVSRNTILVMEYYLNIESDRKRREDFFLRYKSQLEEASFELFQYQRLFYQRFLFKGTKNQNPDSDVIFFGNRENGIVADKKGFLDMLLRRPYRNMHGLHIGELFLKRLNPDSVTAKGRQGYFSVVYLNLERNLKKYLSISR